MRAGRRMAGVASTRTQPSLPRYASTHECARFSLTVIASRMLFHSPPRKPFT